jgi:hypothetical protein
MQLDPERVIVVYPEVVSGNPLGAKHVVRYVLNHPGLLGGDTSYNPDELVIYYADYYHDSASRAAGRDLDPSHCIQLGIIEPFFAPSPHIEGIADATHDLLFYGKGAKVPPEKIRRTLDPLPFVELTADWPATREGLAVLLQSSRAVYTTDTNTMLVEEAMMCGARAYRVDQHGGCLPIAPPADPSPHFADPLPVRQFVDLVRVQWPAS